MDSRILVTLLAFMLLFGSVFAILDSGEIKIFAVTDDEVGMAADLSLYTIPGAGEVSFVTSNSLVGKDTQTTGNIALDIAREKTGEPANQQTFIFDIRANATEVEGPSAGAAMTLLAYSLLDERPLRAVIGITGTINSDGSVGVVGGVFPKAKVASEIGIKLFMIPKGESRQVIKEGDSVQSINLLTYGPDKLGMKVVEVSMIDEVIEYAYSDIDSIEVDTTASANGFVPDAITYKPLLEPMKEMSQTYVDRANGMIEEAKKELETTTLGEDVRSRFYPRLGVTERNAEMAAIFLDQNYLYSSANFAFNARILAGAVKEIANNPSLINKGSTVLNNKINNLRREIDLTKENIDYITLDNFEWIIGAQQRIAYAENALNDLEENPANTEEVSEDEIEDRLFNRVYDYVSAEAWLDAAKDFLNEAKKSKQKRVPEYSGNFILKVQDKMDSIEIMIGDANVSEGALSEAVRRFNAAIISYDNNFYFAALYDAYFSEAFLISEGERVDFDDEEILSTLEIELSDEKETTTSVWGGLFLDHAGFFLENAKYEQELGKFESARASMNTSYDLVVLAKNIKVAKREVDFYLAANTFIEYIDKPELDTTVDISYTKRFDALQLVSIILVVAIVVIIGILMFFSLKMHPSTERGPIRSRIAKVERVRGNLESALSKKKITDAEYFFMKKRYDDELKSLKTKQSRTSKTIIGLDESKAKLKALVVGRKALQKHYKVGIVIEEDYKKHYVELTREIESLKGEIHMYEVEIIDGRHIRPKRKVSTRVRRKSKPRSKRMQKRAEVKVKGTKEPSDDIKGSDDLGKEQKANEKAEANKRKTALKKYKKSKKKK